MRNFVKTAGIGITAVSIGLAAFAMTTAGAATHNPHATTTTLAPPQQGDGSTRSASTLTRSRVQAGRRQPQPAARRPTCSSSARSSCSA